MAIIKILEKFFKGYTVLGEINSPINGKIQVKEDLFGKRRLVVGGLTQSGEAVEKIWLPVIKQLSNPSAGEVGLAIKNCLIFGLGAGSAAKLVSRYFPGAEITGIEIDPEIIRLGKKYFGLRGIVNLKITIVDATLCINELIHCNKRFSLVLVDLYIGDRVPASAEKDKFLKNIKKILAPDGLAIFNRLYYSEKIEKTCKFAKKLKKYFPKIEAKIIKTNKLFLCQNIDTK